jgi:hypothetical protein
VSGLPTVGRRLLAAGVAAALVLGLSPSGAGASTLFSKVPGEMAEARYAPVADTLPNGTVLVAGGYVLSGKPLKTADVFNPASGMFQRLAGELNEPRGEGASAVLPNGKVLLAGGYNFTPKGHPLKTAELFDPETNTFLKLSAEMATERDGPVAAPLPNGKVLITGGETEPSKPVKSAELFNPTTNGFEKLAGEAIAGRYLPAAVALPNGKVLIAGGGGEGFVRLKSAELFNPETNTFEALTGPTHELTEPREELAAVLLQSGRALLVGGFNSGKGLTSAELFSFETNTFETLSTELTEPREGPAAALLPDGRALIVGGYNPTLEPEASRYLKTAELTSVIPPTATTLPPTTVATAAATLNGTALTEATGVAYFQYGTSTAYGSSTPHQTIAAALTPRAVAANVAGLSSGMTYHFRTVVENIGGASFGADQTFTTLAAPSHPPFLSFACMCIPPRPVVSAVRESHSLWREGGKLTRISRKTVPVGTTFSFALNERAMVTFAFTQQASGRKVGGRCVAETKANRHTSACQRAVTRGTLTFAGHPGTNRIAFQGRLSATRKLRPGTYALVVMASTAAGHAAPARLTFTIIR